MKTVILEDEALTAIRLQGLLQQYDANIEVLAVLPSIKESVKWFQTHAAPDLVLMDIHLEDDLVFSLFDQVKLQVPVIFTTAYDEYMIRAFKVNSVDYLLKPINFEELVRAIDKFRTIHQTRMPDVEKLLQYISDKKNSEYKTRFMITVGSKIKSIEVRDIAYFYSADKMTFLMTNDGHALPVEFSLDKLEETLNPIEYFRISRQCIVGYSAILNVHTHIKGKLKLDLRPTAKTEMLVSGDRMTAFKEWLGR